MYCEQAEIIYRGSKLSGNSLHTNLSLVPGKWIRIILWAWHGTFVILWHD